MTPDLVPGIDSATVVQLLVSAWVIGIAVGVFSVFARGGL